MTWRIAVGGIEHETTSFIPGATPLEEFLRRRVSGSEILGLGAANTVMDGYVSGLRNAECEIVPLSWVKGISGGVPTRETFETLVDDLLDRLRNAGPVDGVLLSLHGSFAADGIDDADGEVLLRVRKAIGAACPLMAVHDMHANLSATMASAADALFVMRTYPHVDMAERAGAAVQLMRRTLSHEVAPTMAFRSIPLLWSAPKMIDAEPPMQDVVTRLRALDAEPGVITASVGVGYQWIDSPVVGASTLVVTDGNADVARDKTDTLARWIWDRRQDWQRASLTAERALELGQAVGRYPLILADQGDNTGGGAPGDGTEILRLFIDRDFDRAAVLYLVDPEVAAAAAEAGAGATLALRVGGKSHHLLGPPLNMQAEVLACSDGRFTYDGPMWAGVEGDVGPTVLLRQRGVYAIVISRPAQPIDLALARSLGLDCATMRYLCVKSTGHFRSGFGPIAGSIYNVDTASLLTQDFSKLPFQRLGRGLFPLHEDAHMDWS